MITCSWAKSRVRRSDPYRILRMQEFDTMAINEIIDKVAEVKGLKYKPSDYISTTLIPPVILILQLIEMTLSTVGNISGVFMNMGVTIDPYYFLQQYVPHIDWDKFREASEKKQLDDKTKESISGASGQGGSSPGGGVY